MQDLIESELRQVVVDWKANRRIECVPLGHPVRVDKDGAEVRHVFRQRKVLDYVVGLIETCKFTAPASHGEFLQFCHPVGLTKEESDAGESLAWKALLRGWDGALAGFPRSMQIRREDSAA